MTDIRWYETLESTNNEAKTLLSELDNLSVIAAIKQTSGRGQGDHKWHSLPGENLTFSIVLKFGGDDGLAPLEARDSLLITEVITLALRKYLGAMGIDTFIKWPNDIWCGRKKICGILIENVISGAMVKSSIIGVGLNLNQKQFPADLPNPVSAAQITGRSFDIVEELETLHAYLRECAEMTNTAEGRRYLDESFKENMVRLS